MIILTLQDIKYDMLLKLKPVVGLTGSASWTSIFVSNQIPKVLLLEKTSINVPIKFNF